jgi:hypothetical protein
LLPEQEVESEEDFKMHLVRSPCPQSPLLNAHTDPPTLSAKYSISIDTIEKDLTAEAPQWILSAYAPGRNAPEQLFGGYPREQSFEEMRLHFMMGKASGNEQQAVSTPSAFRVSDGKMVLTF